VEVDSSTSVIPTELAEGTEDPRPPMPEFLRFLEQVSGWVYGPPVIEHLDVVRWLYTCSEPSARNPPFDRKGDLGKGRASGHLARTGGWRLIDQVIGLGGLLGDGVDGRLENLAPLSSFGWPSRAPLARVSPVYPRGAPCGAGDGA